MSNDTPPMPPMPPGCPNCDRPDISTDSLRWFCECGWSVPIQADVDETPLESDVQVLTELPETDR